MNLVSTKWELCFLSCAGCCLMLGSVEETNFLGSGDRRVVLLLETHVYDRKVDRRVLAADIDAELGLVTCVWDRTRRSTPERSRARV